MCCLGICSRTSRQNSLSLPSQNLPASPLLLLPLENTEGLRVDGEKGLHFLLRDFVQLLLDESSAGGGWGGVVREARAEERRKAEAAGDDPGDVSRQPLLGVGNRLVSHLMSVSSYPDGKTAMLRANVMLVAGLVGLFGDVFIEVEAEGAADGHRGGGGQDSVIRMEGHQMGRFVCKLVLVLFLLLTMIVCGGRLSCRCLRLSSLISVLKPSC